MTRHFPGIIFLGFLSVSAAANALPTGFYVGGQLGYANTHLPSLSSDTVTQDIYTVVGVIPGSDVNLNGVPIHFNTASVDSISLGSFESSSAKNALTGHIYFGYQFLDQLALEFGYLYLRSQSENYTSNSTTAVSGSATVFGVTGIGSANFNAITRKDTFSKYALDLNVKAIVPINYLFNIYAKIGAAYLVSRDKTLLTLENSSDITFNGVPQSGSILFETSSSNRHSKIYPAIGLGASYNITRNSAIDASWYRIVAKDTNSSNIDILFLGFAYNFGYLFCDGV